MGPTVSTPTRGSLAAWAWTFERGTSSPAASVMRSPRRSRSAGDSCPAGPGTQDDLARGRRRDLHRANQGPAELLELAIHVGPLPPVFLAPLGGHRHVLHPAGLLAAVRDQLHVLELGDLLLEMAIDAELIHGDDEEDVGRRPAFFRDPRRAGRPRLRRRHGLRR